MSIVSAVAGLAFRSVTLFSVGGATGYASMKGNVWGTPAESAQVVDSLTEKAGFAGSVRQRLDGSLV